MSVNRTCETCGSRFELKTTRGGALSRRNCYECSPVRPIDAVRVARKAGTPAQRPQESAGDDGSRTVTRLRPDAAQEPQEPAQDEDWQTYEDYLSMQGLLTEIRPELEAIGIKICLPSDSCPDHCDPPVTHSHMPESVILTKK